MHVLFRKVWQLQKESEVECRVSVPFHYLDDLRRTKEYSKTKNKKS
jgi:hypothetical protein